MLKLMFLTNNIENVKEAERAGIDRIFLDLEYINKIERQRGRNTLISNNNIEDVAKLRNAIKKAELLVRVNPIHPGSTDEINRVINDGADIVMLPMFMDAEDVQQFIDIVDGRAKVCLLLETSQALVRLDDILKIKGIDEIHIGLNDLHISLGLKFMFETLTGGIVEYISEKIKAKNIPFGFGGIAKIGEGAVPTEYIIGEHYRLNSSMVILSRTFRNEVGRVGEKVDLKNEILKIRNREQLISKWSKEDFSKNTEKVKLYVDQIVNK